MLLIYQVKCRLKLARGPQQPRSHGNLDKDSFRGGSGDKNLITVSLPESQR